MTVGADSLDIFIIKLNKSVSIDLAHKIRENFNRNILPDFQSGFPC